MAVFKVKRVVDAFVVYTTEVEADTPNQASMLASENEENYNWGEGEAVEYDARRFVTLDAEGLNEIESTERGDL